jgi:VIT1/CCC1 family predicted Fe2+/Mn2+ transporter
MNKASLYIRNFVFGVEDSLVSTGGVLTGIAFAGVSKSTILLTGIVVIFVEAFSMGAGSFLSEHSVQGYEQGSHQPFGSSFAGGVVMFFSYFVAGFITLTPYLIWEPHIAIKVSVIAALVALFILGLIIARISKVNMLKEAFKMVIVGGIAMGLGILVGSLVE